MPSRSPFVDPATGTLETDQILFEAVTLAKLIGVFVGLSLVPFGLAVFSGGNALIGGALTVLAQIILAVGAGVVLIYVIARSLHLAGVVDANRE